MVKRIFLVLLVCVSIVMMAALSAAVYAGCCINTGVGSGCVDSSGSCSAGSYVSDSCSVACAKGCCCVGSSSGTVNYKYSCSSTGNFVEDSTLGLLGSVCSCQAQGEFSISGNVVEENNSANFLVNAVVSSSGKTVNTNTTGNFVLTGIPGGSNVLVKASKTGCLPGSKNIPLLSADVKDLSIALNCACASGSCNPASSSYCTANKQWKSYDLSVTAQKAEYCGFCGVNDPIVCGLDTLCVGGDFTCPAVCSDDSASLGRYDPDCVCGATKNGVCPAQCTMASDADCNIYAPVCGDSLGIVTFPYETCEKTPGVGQRSLCSGDDCVACNCQSLSGCGNFKLEAGEQCEVWMGVCPDGSQCEACNCGTPACTGTKINANVTASFFATSGANSVKKIILNWNQPSTCKPSISSHLIYRCQKDRSGACVNKGEFSLIKDGLSKDINTFEDLDIKQNSEYCYFIKTDYIDRTELGESAIVCMKTGSAYCMELSDEDKSKEFCLDNSRKKCDSNNNIVTVADCVSGSFCMGPNADGATTCEATGYCDLCNGMFGLYANLDLRVLLMEGGVESWKWCRDDSTGSRDVLSGCYYDNTKTIFSAFEYCSGISSCYSYKSESACTDPADPCKKNQGCEWVFLDSNAGQVNEELRGICRPTNPQLYQCDLCDKSEYNWISPSCTADVCKLFGQCYYTGGSLSNPNAPSCSAHPVSRCLDYKTAADCNGGVDVSVDVQYVNGKRASGTNNITPSGDKLSLGKCYWDSVNTKCKRNADNNPLADCKIGDDSCEADFTDPKTTIITSGFVYPASMKIRFSILDNYPAELIGTSFCVVPTGAVCYPNETMNASKGLFEKRMKASGTYALRYYSFDPAKNLEPVQEATILVDAEPPVVDLTDPSNVSTFPTNQMNVSVTGIVDTDAKFVCAKNKKTNVTDCINNCALTNDREPCFSAETGIFELTVPIGNNNLTDVVFMAEDFAGNPSQNTLLGILLDILPPEMPEITIAAEEFDNS